MQNPKDQNQMSVNDNIDIDAFQAEVLSSIELLRAPLPNILRTGKMSSEDRELLERLLVRDLGAEQAYAEVAKFAALGVISNPAKELVSKRLNAIESANAEAQIIVEQTDVRYYICPGLQSISDDVFAIAKAITPVLLTLSLVGTIVIPANPLVFGAIALMISRIGVATLCSGYNPKKKKDQD